ncbi:MAG: hypothetical protein K1Y36_30110 [Blastocatellia bacterium]|nr:hypothetical protein [Blastocatellia bacterium]
MPKLTITRTVITTREVIRFYPSDEVNFGWCAVCRKEVFPLTLEQTAEALKVEVAEVYIRLAAGEIHLLDQSGGSLRICSAFLTTEP